MYGLTKRAALECRLKQPVRFSVFKKHAHLFYGVLALMLVFFAVAAVHELIPGLCSADENGDNDCPFCKLVFSFTLIVLALAGFSFLTLFRNHLRAGTEPPQRQIRYPYLHLRAPPAF